MFLNKRCVNPVNQSKKLRLDVENLGERLMPAVSISVVPVLGGNKVQILGDDGNNTIVIPKTTYSPNGTTKVTILDGANRALSRLNVKSLLKIEFDGKDGNNYFTNNTSVPSSFKGGNGKDYFLGGSGNDVFMGNAGNDSANGRGGNDKLYGGIGDDSFLGSEGTDLYYGEDGQNILYRNGFDGYFQDSSPTNYTVGLNDGTLSTEAAFDNSSSGMVVSLSRNTLTINGPTGAGFKLVGTWDASKSTATQNIYFSTNVVLKSAAGDISLVGAPVLIKASKVPGEANVGVYQSFKQFNYPLDSKANDFISTTLTKAGFGLKQAGIGFDIVLGKDIRAIDPTIPVLDSVPYLYGQVVSGAKISYKSVELKLDQSVSIAFDPSDPAVFMKIEGTPVIQEVALGFSKKGQFRYTPTNVPDGMIPPKMLGHLFAGAEISLDKLGVPFAVGGNMLVNLDADHDGKLLNGLSSNVIFSMINDPKKISAVLSTALTDVTFGVNGVINGEFGSLSINMGKASGWYDGKTLAFRAQAQNPFKDSVLDFLDIQSAADIQGHYTSTNDWGFKANIANSGVFGLNGQQLILETSSKMNGVSLEAKISKVGLIDDVTVKGTVGFDGNFTLSGQVSMNHSVSFLGFDVDQDFVGTLNITHINGTTWLGGKLTSQLEIGNSDNGASGSMNVTFGIWFDEQGKPHFEGAQGTFNGKVRMAGITYLDGPLTNFGIDSSGIGIKMPSIVPNLHLSW